MSLYACGLNRQEPKEAKDRNDAFDVLSCSECADRPSCAGGPRIVNPPHIYQNVVASVKKGGFCGVNMSEFYMDMLSVHFRDIADKRREGVIWRKIAEDLKPDYPFVRHVTLRAYFTRYSDVLEELTPCAQ